MDGFAFSLPRRREEREPEQDISQSMRARRLLDHFADLSRPHTFAPGDLVVLKAGMANFAYPRPGQPCIVYQRLDPPLQGDGEKELEHGAKLDIRLAVLVGDGVVTLCPFESAMFEPYTGPID